MLAFVFPGQGSQSVGMLADLAARSARVKDAFDEASEGAGVDLYALASSGPDAALNQTEFTQPALLAAGVAVYRLWRDAGGDEPAALAGHSLGEYAALVAAGALALGDAARLVRERGRLMQSAVPPGVGAMAAVLGTDDVALIERVCREVAGSEVVAPANFNGPGQTVIAGHRAAVERALGALVEAGVRKHVMLPVSVPSHTALMAPAAAALGAALANVALRAPRIPVIHNVDGDTHSEPAAIVDALVRQLHQPVRWTLAMTRLIGRGATRFGECGPGKVLTGIARRVDRALDARALGSAADFDAALSAWSAR